MGKILWWQNRPDVKLLHLTLPILEDYFLLSGSKIFEIALRKKVFSFSFFLFISANSQWISQTASYNRLFLSVQRRESPEKLSLHQSAVLKLLRQTWNKIENSGRSLGKKKWWMAREAGECSPCFCDTGLRCLDQKNPGKCEREDRQSVYNTEQREKKTQGRYPEC